MNEKVPTAAPSDTGRSARVVDERSNLSRAKVFDTLVESNLQLVKSTRASIFIMVVCGIAATSTTVYSAFILRMGQQETRDLIRQFAASCERRSAQ